MARAWLRILSFLTSFVPFSFASPLGSPVPRAEDGRWQKRVKSRNSEFRSVAQSRLFRGSLRPRGLRRGQAPLELELGPVLGLYCVLPGSVPLGKGLALSEPPLRRHLLGGEEQKDNVKDVGVRIQ